ncbi:Uncharacterised protein [Mycobacteroides abscessus subsp. abscessus]|nr:Uncharacterised protein [Mycobacteroides abscessus subsp. abscessus]
MDAAVGQRCARGDLTLDEIGEVAPDGRIRPAVVTEVERRDAIRGGCLVVSASQRNHHVGVDEIGHPSTLVVGCVAATVVRQERFHSCSGHPALEACGEIPQHAGFQLGDGSCRKCVHPSGSRIDDDPLTGQLRAGASNMLFLADRIRRPAGHTGTEPVECAQRRRTANAVGRESVLALVEAHRVVGALPEDAVDESGVVAEVLQSALECGDVVADHGSRQSIQEHARAELIRRLAQRPIRRLADNAVDDQAALLLERAHGMVDIDVEEGVLGAVDDRTVLGRFPVGRAVRRRCSCALGCRVTARSGAEQSLSGEDRSNLGYGRPTISQSERWHLISSIGHVAVRGHGRH